MSAEPKLTVELIPTSLHGKNPRTAMGKGLWEQNRKRTCEAAGTRREVCGVVANASRSSSTSTMNTTRPAGLPASGSSGLIAPCPDCHAVKHLARTRLVAREQRDPQIYDDALRHLARVNEWDDQQVRDYLAEIQAEFRRREALGEWTQGFSPLLGTDP